MSTCAYTNIRTVRFVLVRLCCCCCCCIGSCIWNSSANYVNETDLILIGLMQFQITVVVVVYELFKRQSWRHSLLEISAF